MAAAREAQQPLAVPPAQIVQAVRGARATEYHAPEFVGVEKMVLRQLAVILLVMAPHYPAPAKAVISLSILA